MTEGVIKSDAKPRGTAIEVSKRLSLKDRALRFGGFVGGFAFGLMLFLMAAGGVHELREYLQRH